MKIEKRQNFISVDEKTSITSYGDYFTVGEVVGHEGATDTATIISFETDMDDNEIRVITDKGSAHIDFLVKLPTPSTLKATFETDDPKEMIRLAKSTDMALFIWELVHNGWRDFKHTDYEYEKAWEKIHELLDEHGIVIDDLIE